MCHITLCSLFQVPHYLLWLMVEANKLAVCAGQSPPYPRVQAPREDNGEEWLWDYFVSQLKREQEPGWIEAVLQLKPGEELTHCPCKSCTARRRVCTCEVCQQYRKEHPEFAPRTVPAPQACYDV